MKILIIEDEMMAALALQKLIAEVNPDVEIVGHLETIEDSVEWFKSHPMPDILFTDIRLADGSAFTIFDKVSITCPVIFTTAYDEYALQAFEVNSIDYILKPINKMDLERALNKFNTMLTHTEAPKTNASGEAKKHKQYFLVPERDKLIPLKISDIAYFYIETKTVRAVTLKNRQFNLNQTLDDLMAQLDPDVFFRANRQFIVSRHAVKDLSVWFANRLSINLLVDTPEKIFLSRARVSEFKAWFLG